MTTAAEPRTLTSVRRNTILALLAFTAVCHAWQPIQIRPYPQKFRTFYALDDPRVPAALSQGGSSLTASDGARWRAVSGGLRREDQFFSGKRYLPDNEVLHIMAGSAGDVWVRTRTGISHIELRPMTMAQKAAFFEERVHERHDRHGLVAPSILRVPGDLSSNQTRDDDNDGLWTSMYAAAECFRYAVTHSAEALANATKSIEAVLFLEEVAGRRGFPARSYIEKGEPMPRDGVWHWTADGRYYWKGDTSSDEIVGHFFLYGIAWDLLPDSAVKQRIAATAARIMDHIVEHGYYLIDVTGSPTTWGRWSEEYFKQEPSDSALNSIELLSFLKTAAHITGDSRYEREYGRLSLERGYAKQATRYLELSEEINYSDEELAMLSFYGLFRYETDKRLLDKSYRPALNGWWVNASREENPLWTFIYALAVPDAPVDFAAAVRTLYRMPMDTVGWTVTNSTRPDVVMDTALDRFGHRQAKTLLPPDERPVMKWNANPFDLDGGADGRQEDDGAAFLLPYWMGRYHRLLLGE